MTTSWLKWFAIGLTAMAGATACVVTTDDDGDDDFDGGEGGEGGEADDGGRAGRGGSGGRSGAGSGGTSGRAGSGGTSAGTGGTPSGGSAGSDGGYNIVCETAGPTSTPATTCEFSEEDLDSPALEPIRGCLECLSANCCDDLKNCYGTGTTSNNVCGWGGPNKGETEYLCYQTCISERALANDGAYDPKIDVGECAEECVSTADNGSSCDAIGNHTNDVITCLNAECEDECILDPK